MAGVPSFIASTRSPALPSKWFAGELWAAGLILIFLLLAVRQLSVEWTINPEYQYGWLVPGLALLLWWKAWKRRPPAAAPSLRRATASVFFLAIWIFPIRILQEANPDWRFLDLYFGLQVVFVALLVIDHSGGWPWLRHFAFSVFFFLAAVPWPTTLEVEIIQGLQRGVSSFAVETISWFGGDAIQRGNLIVLPQGVVGVNEACSGIRSLQSSLMISLFLGDYFSLPRSRRFLLVFSAPLLAICLNAARVLILVAAMSGGGRDSISKFHDPAGFAISATCLVLLWLRAASWAPGASALLAAPCFPRSSGLRAPVVWFIIAVGAVLLAEGVNDEWYAWNERSMVSSRTWTITWPVPRPGFKETPIDETARSYLRYDSGHHGSWRDQYQWDLFFFTWDPGRTAAGLAQTHRPDICLPAAGFLLKKEVLPENIVIEGVNLPLSAYVFKNPLDGRLLYVFQSVADDRTPSRAMPLTSPGGWGRLMAAWYGIRNKGQRSILLVIQGAADLDEARVASIRCLDQIVKPGGSETEPTQFKKYLKD